LEIRAGLLDETIGSGNEPKSYNFGYEEPIRTFLDFAAAALGAGIAPIRRRRASQMAFPRRSVGTR
jgi:hypothetical protein